MGKASIKENKNIFQLAREEYGEKYEESKICSRQKASELLEWISDDRLEKIENQGSIPRPDEVYQMAKCYRKPELCNQFCSGICEIGKHLVPEVKVNNLERIVLELLNSLNGIEAKKNKLIEITADGVISSDELPDLKEIQDQLEKISITVSALQLWVEKAQAENDKIKEN